MKIVNLSIERKTIPTRIDVVQYATAPDIVFLIEDYPLTAAMTARLYIKKPSGSEVYNNCTVSVANNTVTYTPTTQSFAEFGVCECQLQITTGQKIAVSFLIYADVEKNVIDTEAPQSTDEFNTLEQALNTVDWHEGRVSALEANTVKNNANGSIDGSLSVTRGVTSNTGFTANGGWLTLSNVGDTTNAFESVYFNNANYQHGCFIRAYNIDDNGSAMVIRPGGPLILGGGEFASNYYTDNTPINEWTYLGSDSVVNIISNYGTPEESNVWQFNNAGNLSCPGNITLADNKKIDGLDPSETNKTIVNLNGATTIADKSVPTGTSWTNLGSISFDPGNYIVDILCRFASNAVGLRAICLSETSTGTAIYNKWQQNSAPVNGSVTTIYMTHLLNIDTAKTLYLNAQQNSGGPLVVSTRYSILKLR